MRLSLVFREVYSARFWSTDEIGVVGTRAREVYWLLRSRLTPLLA